MDVTAQRSFLPALVGFWAATIAGCVRDYPADHWLPGVQCEEGRMGMICLDERPDRRSGKFVLAPDCRQGAAAEAAGINAQRMTLIGDGYDIVFAGTHTTTSDASASPGRIAIARFADGGACPPVDWPDFPWAQHAANAAHVVGPNGRFWSFGGDVGGTRGARSYDRTSGWVVHPAVVSPTPAVGDGQNWIKPNGLAIALPGSGVAILRSVARNDPQTTEDIPTSLEWWQFGPGGSPALVSQTQLASGMAGYAAVQSLRGQVRLFAVGDRLVVQGDYGRAVALSPGDSPPMPISERLANDDNDLTPNRGSTTVLLPLRPGSPYPPGSVLYVGGAPNNDVDPEERQLDLFDPASGSWTHAGRVLPRGRSYAAPILLPDGKIMLAGDAQGAGDIFYIDPQRDFRVTVGHAILDRTRGMGVGGLVLADGRVVLAGGNQPDGDELRAPPDVELWDPPYLHAGSPGAPAAIAALSGPIPVDGTYAIEMAAGSPEITEVVLLAYGSSFMGNNPNQRLVELEIDRDRSNPGSRTIALHGPRAGWAPAGRYLLFALTADRIPSPGLPVDVVDSAPAP